MFLQAGKFNVDISSWNTSTATNFKYMFFRATAFKQPLDSWNTEKATNFEGMFYWAHNFNQPLGSWNTEKVTDFNNIFGGTSVPIDTTAYWDTTNSRSGRYLFPQQPCPAGYNASQSYRNGGGGL